MIECGDNDRELLLSAQQGNQAGFEALYRKYCDSVYKRARWIVNDVTLAEDVVQETFLRLFRDGGGFRGESSLKTYVMRIAINCALDELGKRTRFGATRAGAQEASDGGSSALEIETGAGGAPDADPVDELKAAVRSLDDEERMVVALRRVEGVSYEEIAKQTGKGIDDLKKLMKNAMRKLRRKSER